MLLQSPVWATRRRGATVHAPRHVRIKYAIKRVVVRRASEAPRSSEAGGGIGSLRKSVGRTYGTAPLYVTLIADTSDATAGRRHMRPRCLILGRPTRNRAQR